MVMGCGVQGWGSHALLLLKALHSFKMRVWGRALSPAHPVAPHTPTPNHKHHHSPTHPAEPAATPISRVPADYMERVRQTHQSGGFGSIG